MNYTVWLQLCLGAGYKHIAEVFKTFGNAQNVYNASYKDLLLSKLFTKNELKKLSTTNIMSAEDILSYCKKNNIQIIPYGSENYPKCLSSITDPPILLYVKGELPNFDETPTVAIVGPRKVSEFGKKCAYSLGYRLGKAGMIVVSGGALGADTYAHVGALKSGGKTVLVMGCGIDYNYLEENKTLREKVAKNGCLISEHPPLMGITKYTFPIRNRLISALSLGTVVVEASNRSGALLTANHANEQGRDVFVIPGSPEQKQYKGSNALLRDGAKPLLDTSDIFNEYIVRFPDKIDIEKAYEKPKEKKDTKISKKNIPETLSKEAKIVYNCLDKEKFYPEELNVNLESSQLLSALTELEMEFIIEALPGGQYRLVNQRR